MKRLVVLTLIILTLGLLPVFLNFGDLGFCDFTKQQIPFIVETKRMLSTGAPWWSWNTFIGDNFIAGYSFYTLTSPFVWIAALFPYKYILWGILLNLYLKTLLTSAFAYLYFRKMEFNENLSITGALLYAFSSFYICSLFYFHFAEPILLFPLLLIALEMVLRKENSGFFWLGIIAFGITFINYYFAFSSLFLGLLYFLFRGYSLRTLNLKIFLKAVSFVVLGVLMASFILFPIIEGVMNSPRAMPGRAMATASENDHGFFFKLLEKYVPRLQSLFFPTVSESNLNDFVFDNSHWNSVIPFVTLFGLLPAFIYFIRKKDWLGWLIVVLLLIFLTPLNGIFYLFTSFTYGRWLYGFILLVILASLYVVKDRIHFSSRLLWIYISLAVFCIIINFATSYYIAASTGEPLLLDPFRFWLLALGILNLVCLAVWVFNREKISLLLFLVVICTTCNFFAFSSNLLTRDGEARLPSGTLDAAAYNSTSNEYMTHRTDYLSPYLNQGMLDNSPSVYSFHSVFNNALTPFRSAIDDNYLDPEFRINKGNRASVASLLSVKEVKDFHGLSENELNYDHGLSLISKGDNFDVYSFDDYIPLGFSYDSYLPVSSLESMMEVSDSIDVAGVLLTHLVINDSEISEFEPYLKPGNISTAFEPKDSVLNARREFTINDFRGSTRGFTANSDFPDTKVIFFSVPADKGFKAFVDGKQVKIYNVNLGMSAIIVPDGYHDIRFDFFPPGMLTGSIVSCVALIFFFFFSWLSWRKREVLI